MRLRRLSCALRPWLTRLWRLSCALRPSLTWLRIKSRVFYFGTPLITVWPPISPAANLSRISPTRSKSSRMDVLGPACRLQAAGDQVLSWQAGANIFAQRGTLAFFWRARDPIGRNPFPLFRVGYGDHTSWDMVWLRMDWNGHGIDAFVTDDNLARVRVSYSIPEVPRADQWTHLALSWDETTGIRLYVNGVLAARKDAVAVLDSGLDQFGPHSRVVSPHQVQSAYSYLRGGDLDEIRIYDHALDDAGVAALAKSEVPNDGAAPARDLTAARWKN
jgi:Concanavalin A-like lectin/glucanases superfamily